MIRMGALPEVVVTPRLPMKTQIINLARLDYGFGSVSHTSLWSITIRISAALKSLWSAAAP